METGKTPRVWLYAPGDDAYKWDEFYDDGIMGMGWDQIGDYSQYHSKKEIEQKLKEVYPTQAERPTNSARSIWQFLKEVRVGDIVFAKRGMSQIMGKGIVTSEPRFDAERKEFKNYRTVNWTNNEVKENKGKRLPQVTFSEAQPHRMDFLMSLYEDDSEGKESK